MRISNNNRLGYKKATTGWIPDEWKEVALEDIAQIERGKFSARPRNDPKYYGGPYPFLQTGDVSTSDGIVYSYSQTLNASGLAVSKLFPSGTLLVTIAANIGDVAEVPFDFACPDSLVAVQANENIHRLWLKCFLKAKKKYFVSKATQNAQANINLQTIRPTLVQLPPLLEQEAIAAVLVCWDKAIRHLEVKIGIKLLIKKGLVQRLISGQIRIPGFSKQWETVKLSEVLTEHKENSSGSEEVHSVSVHKGVINQVEHLGRSFSAKDTSKYNLVKPGDIIYTKSPTGDFPLGIIKQSKLNTNAIVSPLYGVFTPMTKHLGLILDCFFDSPTNTGNYLRPLIQKGAKNTINITNTTFLSGKMPLPLDKDEQRAIADVLKAANAEIEALKQKLSLLKMQKRFLLNNLVTGTIRLPEFRMGN